MRLSIWMSRALCFFVAITAVGGARLAVAQAWSEVPSSQMDEISQRVESVLEEHQQKIRSTMEQIKQMEAEIAAGREEQENQLFRLRTELKSQEQNRDRMIESFRRMQEEREKQVLRQRREEEEQTELRRREEREQMERERPRREMEMRQAEMEVHYRAKEEATLQARIAMDEVASAAFALGQLERLVPEPEEQLKQLNGLLAETDHPAIKRLLRMKILEIAGEHDREQAMEQLKALIQQRPDENAELERPLLSF